MTNVDWDVQSFARMINQFSCLKIVSSFVLYLFEKKENIFEIDFDKISELSINTQSRVLFLFEDFDDRNWHILPLFSFDDYWIKSSANLPIVVEELLKRYVCFTCIYVFSLLFVQRNVNICIYQQERIIRCVKEGERETIARSE